jgi:hypothetical protein
MKRLTTATVLTALMALVGVAAAQADSIEGVWKIESGRWPGDGADMAYPGDGGGDAGAAAFRMFTGSHHFFISSFPAIDVYNASMSRYSLDGNTLKMEKILAPNPQHLDAWEWTYELEGDRLTLEREGMNEVWVRVE